MIAVEERDATSWLKEINQACEMIRDVSYTLSRFSNAFYTIGNEQMSKECALMRKDLNNAEKMINGACGQHCHDMVVSSDQATKNMMEALIGGISIGKGAGR